MNRILRREIPEGGKVPLAAAALVLLAMVIYLPSFDVPWYFDDYFAILDNKRVSELGSAWANFFAARGVSFLSFALNYHFAEFSLFGFHLVNLIIHVACAVLVFCLLRAIYTQAYWIPLFGALVFLCHPLQTQAVTYVVQRMASLCALFFLLSVFVFLKFARLDGTRPFPAPASWGWGALTLVFGMLAVLSKENAAVLPLVLWLWLYCDLGSVSLTAARRWRVAGPFLAVMLVPFVQYLVIDLGALGAVSGAVEFFVGHGDGSGRVIVVLGSEIDNLTFKYLITQVVVFWTYVRLLFFPLGQMLDYSFPLVETVFSVQFGVCFLALAGLLSLTSVFLKKHKRLCFGIWWIVITLSVESSFIPLDPIFEHRLYLPMFGFVIVLIELLNKLSAKALLPLALALLAVFSGLTFQRNLLWADPVAMWSDNLEKAPHSYRVKLNLAKAYIDRGDELESMEVLKEVFRENPSAALKNNQRYYENFVELGKSYFRNGMVDDAVAHFERGTVLYPESAPIHMFLSALYQELGRAAAAREAINTAYRLSPRDPQVAAQYRRLMGR